MGTEPDIHNVGHGHHQHGHDEHKTVGQHDQQHFDSVASHVFTQEWVIQLSNQILHEIQSNFDWLGVKNRGRMLDYACGDGLASRALAPYMASIIGMDLSSGMVDEYNRRCAKEVLGPDQVHAIQGDILELSRGADEGTDDTLQGFDLIVISMALHHVEDPPRVIKELGKRLRPGGVLLVVEWLATAEGVETSSAENPLQHIISKHGFTVKDMEEYIAKAELKNAQTKLFGNTTEMPAKFGSCQRLFLARAQRP